MTLHRLLLGVAAAAAMSTGFAQQKSLKIVTVNEAHEVRASALTLPSGDSGVAVFSLCKECPAKTFPANADTKYTLRNTPVTLADLRTAILGKPETVLTVMVSVKSGALISIDAPVAPTSAVQRRTP